jgi:hypothetical protein
MNLSDKDILELNELCNGLVEGALSEKQKARLSEWLRGSEEARQFYVRAMGLSASLVHYAAEMQAEAPEPVQSRAKVIPLFAWVFGPLAAAACVAVLIWIWRPKPASVLVESRAPEFVAQLTGLKECSWPNNAPATHPGDRLFKGQRLEITAGFAEITFDSGGQVLLEGPASFEVNSAWGASLARGTLKASVPPQAIGFRISNPSVEVVDLGTEFTMSADASGVAEVLVLKGQVEAQPSSPDRQPIVLREKESRRFGSSGVTDLLDSAKQFARIAQPLSLDHFSPPTQLIHWSFDETAADDFQADNLGVPVPSSIARLQGATDSSIGTAAHVTGRRHGALRFDGHSYASAQFPGIATYSPHTVAFWVKVPKEANLANAYAMLAWGVNSQRLGSHPIHIAWNRNPNEATVGVLRTDYGGGYAVGSTPLRDGRWHHVAVVFFPGTDPNHPLEVNQYVDGRLEGEGKPSPPGSDIFMRTTDNVSDDAFWLGCRFGINRVRSERFFGDMDELFIANRALEPQEIVNLMEHNQLQIAVAAATKPESRNE